MTGVSVSISDTGIHLSGNSLTLLKGFIASYSQIPTEFRIKLLKVVGICIIIVIIERLFRRKK